jgi:hypothetical protein
MTELAEMEGGNARAYIDGDPTTWTAGQKTRHAKMCDFMDKLESLGSLTQVYALTKHSETTIHRWRTDYPKFAAAVDLFLTQTRLVRLEEAMYTIAMSTDPKMATAAVKAQEFLMRAYDRPKFGDQMKVESTQTVNHMVQVVHSVRDTMREEQQAKLASLQARTITVEPSNSDKEKE